jgi:hypothetical protein
LVGKTRLLNQLTAGNIIVTASDESTVAAACKERQSVRRQATGTSLGGFSDDARYPDFAAQ